MAADFGLDFGTTNSVCAFIGRDAKTRRERAYVLTNRDDGRPHPSVVWYSGGAPVVGRAAKQQLNQLGLGVFGDVVRSPKVFLGSPAGVNVGGVTRQAKDVVAQILQFLRQDAIDRKFPGRNFENAVLTIPVSMLGQARIELREAALTAGFRVHQFVHEPLAALYGHLRALPDFATQLASLERRLSLVFDWGGGTLDLTLCQFLHGVLTQIVSFGDPEVGGDQFDLRLLRFVKDCHEKRYPGVDWTRMQPTGQARLIQACEDAKILLSSKDSAMVDVPEALATAGKERTISERVTRQELEGAVQDLMKRGLGRIREVLDLAGIPTGAIEFCVATGGMVSMPAIREGLVEMFGHARLRVVENAATVIAEGAAWIAHDGIVLKLAKPLELLHADNSYLPIVHSGTVLPTEGLQIQQSVSLYCVDPRDGYAKLTLARPRWPGRESAVEPRMPYAHTTLHVDPYTEPLFERLELAVTIDHNLIANVKVKSEGRHDHAEATIHDLEFGLGLDHNSEDSSSDTKNDESTSKEPFTRATPPRRPSGSVRVRSNVAGTKEWNLVPGEIVQNYRRDLIDERLTTQQRHEKMYYRPCSECGRTAYEIERDGCDKCAVMGRSLSIADAQTRREERTKQGLPV